MQFIRNSLSFSFISNPGSTQQQISPENGPSEAMAPDDGKLPRSASNVSEQTQYATVRSKLPLNLGSPPSAYSTPFQSPVIPSRTFPTLAGAAATLNGAATDGRDDSGNGTMKPERSSKVYFIEQGQLQTDYELPERPGQPARGASLNSGIVNPAFTNDAGATVINMSSTQPRWVRYRAEQCRVQVSTKKLHNQVFRKGK